MSETNKSTFIGDFVTQLEEKIAKLREEKKSTSTEIEEMEISAKALTELNANGDIVAGYISKAIEDVKLRKTRLEHYIKSIGEKIESLDNAHRHAREYWQANCQHNMVYDSWEYHHNYQIDKCTICGKRQ